jgi:hypothetical protein
MPKKDSQGLASGEYLAESQDKLLCHIRAVFLFGVDRHQIFS